MTSAIETSWVTFETVKSRHLAGSDILDNHGVNILSSTASALIGPLCFSILYKYISS